MSTAALAWCSLRLTGCPAPRAPQQELSFNASLRAEMLRELDADRSRLLADRNRVRRRTTTRGMCVHGTRPVGQRAKCSPSARALHHGARRSATPCGHALRSVQETLSVVQRPQQLPTRAHSQDDVNLPARGEATAARALQRERVGGGNALFASCGGSSRPACCAARNLDCWIATWHTQTHVHTRRHALHTNLGTARAGSASPLGRPQMQVRQTAHSFSDLPRLHAGTGTGPPSPDRLLQHRCVCMGGGGGGGRSAGGCACVYVCSCAGQ